MDIGLPQVMALLGFHRGDNQNPHKVTKQQVGLGLVSNAAALLRSAADWAGFPTKLPYLSAADVALVEDSLSAGAKKQAPLDEVLRTFLTTYLWEDVQMSGTALSVGGGVRPPSMGRFRRNGAGTSEGVYLYMFNRSSTAPFPGDSKELFFAFQVPHSYARGQNLHLHLHWSPGATAATAGIVGWKVEYTVATPGGIFPVTGTLDLADTLLVTHPAYEHRITPTGVIPGAGLEESTVVCCRIYRDLVSGSGGNDTWPSDTAWLTSVDLHVPQNKLGTRLEAPPWD